MSFEIIQQGPVAERFDVCVVDKEWLKYAQENIENIAFSGPHEQGSQEFERVNEILRGDTPKLLWQPILCRRNRNLEKHSVKLAEDMTEGTQVFVARVSSWRKKCHFILAVLVCHRVESTMFIDLLCSSVKGSGVGSDLLKYMFSKTCKNDQVQTVKLLPTYDAIDFYKKKGFSESEDFYMTCSVRDLKKYN